MAQDRWISPTRTAGGWASVPDFDHLIARVRSAASPVAGAHAIAIEAGALTRRVPLSDPGILHDVPVTGRRQAFELIARRTRNAGPAHQVLFARVGIAIQVQARSSLGRQRDADRRGGRVRSAATHVARAHAITPGAIGARVD